MTLRPAVSTVSTLHSPENLCIDKGFVDAKQLGDFISGSDAMLNGVNDTFTRA